MLALAAGGLVARKGGILFLIDKIEGPVPWPAALLTLRLVSLGHDSMGWRAWFGVGERRWKKAYDEEVQPSKTLWDWLQLLIVPAILIGVTVVWSAAQTRGDNKREDRRIAADRAAAKEARRDATLRAYLNQMSGLMLHEKLLTSGDLDAVRAVARTASLTTLRRLDSSRKSEVVRFLYEAGLLTEKIEAPVNEEDPAPVSLAGAHLENVDLADADFADADFAEAVLTGADLSQARLSDADFDGADLRGADLEDAYLPTAWLSAADLTGAVLRRADLTDAYMATAVLTGADLRGADLRNADLGGADLKRADLRGAILESAYLTDADLTDANVTGAYLKGAVVNLEGAVGLPAKGRAPRAPEVVMQS
jgi:uncharacterized protein YjbI with pentapeptide repeats